MEKRKMPSNEPYIAPRREDESENDYFYRTRLHENSDWSKARMFLVASRIKNMAGISLDKMNAREMANLTNYYLANSHRNHQPVIDFAKKFKQEGLKTFLACETGIQSGDLIIELGEKLPQQVAEKLFAKYQEVISESSRVLEVIKSFDKQVDPLTEKKIKESLLKKAKDLLVSFHAKADMAEGSEEFISELDVVKADIILFASTFKALSESGEDIDFKEAEQVRMETKKPDDLSPTEKEEMVRIFLANRETGYPEKLLKEVFNDFEESINPDPNSSKASADFTILKYNNQIVSFLRLEPRGKDRVYAAAFNTRPEAKGFKIGNAMMKEVIEKAAENNTIEAVAYSQKTDLLSFYQKFFGFRPVGETEIAGEKFIRIEKPKKAKEQLDLAA